MWQTIVILTVALMVAQPSEDRVAHTYLIGGEGAWDYVVPDPPNHRLFIARQNRVMVVDEDKGTLLGEVTGVDGAAYDAESADAFASNADGTLTIIHQDTPDRYRVVQTLQTPPGSRNMGLDPTNHRVLSCLRSSLQPSKGPEGADKSFQTHLR